MADEQLYDPLEGFSRIAHAVEAIDARTAEVIVLHFALEREIDAVLGKLVVRPEKIIGLNFPNKLKLLHALLPGPSDKADQLFNVLDKFNELRNAFAHSDKSRIKTCYTNLIAAYKSVDPHLDNDPTHHGVAIGVLMYLGDWPMPGEIKIAFSALAEVLKGLSKILEVRAPEV